MSEARAAGKAGPPARNEAAPAARHKRVGDFIRVPLDEQSSHELLVAATGVKQQCALGSRLPSEAHADQWHDDKVAYAMRGFASGPPAPAYGDEDAGAGERAVAEALVRCGEVATIALEECARRATGAG